MDVNPVAHIEDRRLRVSENRVLSGIFRPRWEEVTGGLRKLQNEEFTDCTRDQILFE
jgi:hypothetical protein